MPDVAARPCLYPLCGAYAVQAGRCAEHARAQRQLQDRDRGSSSERGYDAQWQAFRAWFIRRHPVCEDCLEEQAPVLRPTREVHHIRKLAEFPELRRVESNCRGLCKRHHSIRTARGE